MQKFTTTSALLAWARWWILSILMMISIISTANQAPEINKNAASSTAANTLQSLLNNAKIAETEGDLKALTINYYQLGNAYLQLEREEEAANYFQKVVAEGEQWVSKERYQESLHHLASLYFSLKQYGKVIPIQEQLLAIYQAADNTEAVAQSLLELGKVQLILQDLEAAQEFCLQAKELFNEQTPLQAKYDLYATLAAIYTGLGIHHKAIKSSVEALKYAGELERSDLVALSFFHIGAGHFQKEDPDQALYYLHKAADEYEKLEEPAKEAKTYQLLATTYSNIKTHGLAVKIIKDALKLAKETGDIELIKDVSAQVPAILHKSRQTTKAYYFQKDYIQFLDSIRNDAALEQMANLRQKYELQLQNVQKEKERVQAQLNTYEAKNNLHQALAIGLGILGGLLLLLFLAKSKAYRKLAKQKALEVVAPAENPSLVKLHQKATELQQKRLANGQLSTAKSKVQQTETIKTKTVVPALTMDKKMSKPKALPIEKAKPVRPKRKKIAPKTTVKRKRSLPKIAAETRVVEHTEPNGKAKKNGKHTPIHLTEPSKIKVPVAKLSKNGQSHTSEKADQNSEPIKSLPLANVPPTSPSKELMDFHQKAVEHIQTALGKLTDYIQVSSQGTDPEILNTQAIVQEIVAKSQTLIDQKGLEVQIGKLPQVYAEKNQLTLVFDSLISNAIKQSNTAKAQLSIHCMQNGQRHIFSIKDNATNAKTGNTGQIFDISYHLRNGKNYETTGMELAICKNIIEQHQGKMWIEPQPGAGNIYYFTLPIHPPNEQDEPTTSNTQTIQELSKKVG